MTDLFRCERIVGDEKYVIEAPEDGEYATVTDREGTVVMIRLNKGRFHASPQDNLGSSYTTSTIADAVARAVTICIEKRRSLTPEQARQAITDYVKECTASDS